MSKKQDLKALAAQFKRDPDDTSPDAAAVDEADLDAALEARMAAATADPLATDPTPDPQPEPASTPPTPAKRPASGGQRAQRAQRSKASKAKRDSTPMTKSTVQLPTTLAEKLSSAKKGSGRSTADVVVTAYLDHIDAVRAEFAPTEDDQRRLELGLRPLAAVTEPESEPGGHRTQVGLYISVRALEELDAAAVDLSMSRSKLVERLLALEFAAAPA